MAVLCRNVERAELDSPGCEVEPHRDAAHVVPVGEVDVAAVPLVEERLTELYVSGLRLVLKWTGRAGAEGGAAFEVIAGPPSVQRIFALTGTIDRVSFLGSGEAS